MRHAHEQLVQPVEGEAQEIRRVVDTGDKFAPWGKLEIQCSCCFSSLKLTEDVFCLTRHRRRPRVRQLEEWSGEESFLLPPHRGAAARKPGEEGQREEAFCS